MSKLEFQLTQRRLRAYGRLFRWLYETPHASRARLAADALAGLMGQKPQWRGSFAYDAYRAAVAEARGRLAHAIAQRHRLVERIAQAEHLLYAPGVAQRQKLAETIFLVLEDNEKRLVDLYARVRARRSQEVLDRIRDLRKKLVQAMGRSRPRDRHATGIARL